jgi:hypothetical protein
MPASKTTARAKGKGKARKASNGSRASLSKQQVTKVAAMRRQGATWKQVYAYIGRRSNSTQMRQVLERAGFDRFGRKGGKGKSKARGHGAKGDPNINPAPVASRR